MRQRFSTSRVCSSENYHTSKKAHRDTIHREAEKISTALTSVTTSTFIPKGKTPYAYCFGRLFKINIDMVPSFNNIIWQ